MAERDCHGADDRLDAGRITLDGGDIAAMSRHELRRGRERLGGGGNVSAGEKQLLTIARAFLARPWVPLYEAQFAAPVAEV